MTQYKLTVMVNHGLQFGCQYIYRINECSNLDLTVLSSDTLLSVLILYLFVSGSSWGQRNSRPTRSSWTSGKMFHPTFVDLSPLWRGWKWHIVQNKLHPNWGIHLEWSYVWQTWKQKGSHASSEHVGEGERGESEHLPTTHICLLLVPIIPSLSEYEHGFHTGIISLCNESYSIGVFSLQ